MQVVEREMIDKLLQELQLEVLDLASPDTQRQLGKVLSAEFWDYRIYITRKISDGLCPPC
jgi:hypothetical protein